MQRWIARLLVWVMVASALGPLAMASAAPAQAPHCVREQAAKPVMQCHGGMTMAPAPPASETTFGAADSCCQNHDCCRGMAVPQWAQTPSQILLHHGLPTAEALFASTTQAAPSTLADGDSARAPPRS